MEGAVTPHGDLRMAGTVNVRVAAAPEVVFEAIADLPRMGEWSPENLGGDWLDPPPPRVGSTFRGRNRGAHGEWETVLTVTEFEPPKRFTFRVADPGEEGTTWEYLFEPDCGGTRVTERFWWQWTPLPDEGFRGRVGRMPIAEARREVVARESHLQRSAEATLANLKSALEATR